MRLRDVMSADVVTVGPDELAANARARMREHRIRHLVVVEGARLVGVLSERNLGGPRGAQSGKNRTVGDLMTTEVVSASPATTLRQAANLMRGRSIGCLIVVENDQAVGIVTTTDVLDQLGRGATRPTVRTERAPVRRPPGSGVRRGRKAPRAATGPRRGRRPRRAAARRSPLPATMPRAAKHARGRTLDVPPPAHIRVMGAALDDEDRDEIARKLGMRLGKFASSIERISVRLSDVNGPRGGVDQKCVIKVVLSGLPSVVVERVDSALPRAVDGAIAAAGKAVRRSAQRRRLKPLHRRKSSTVSRAS